MRVPAQTPIRPGIYNNKTTLRQTVLSTCSGLVIPIWIVRFVEAIRENPDIILEAVAILQQREGEAQAPATQSVLSDQRMALERDPNAPVLGNPDGNVTIVEFFSTITASIATAP